MVSLLTLENIETSIEENVMVVMGEILQVQTQCFDESKKLIEENYTKFGVQKCNLHSAVLPQHAQEKTKYFQLRIFYFKYGEFQIIQQDVLLERNSSDTQFAQTETTTQKLNKFFLPN